MHWLFDLQSQSGTGEVPDAGGWVTSLIVAVTPITLALITLLGGKRNATPDAEAAEVRARVEERHGVDSSKLDDAMLKMFDRYDTHIDKLNLRIGKQDEKIDKQDVKISALEKREDDLLSHIEDLKQGVEQRRYPPWPPVPH